jgi:hypothetical protein
MVELVVDMVIKEKVDVVVIHIDMVKLCIWTAAINGPIVHSLDDIWIQWNDIDRGNETTRRKLCPSATLPTTCTMWHLYANPGFRNGSGKKKL